MRVNGFGGFNNSHRFRAIDMYNFVYNLSVSIQFYADQASILVQVLSTMPKRIYNLFFPCQSAHKENRISKEN